MLPDESAAFQDSFAGEGSAEISIVTGGEKDKTSVKKQISSTYHCALVFVDISGFTKLSTLLDPESLSKVSGELETLSSSRIDTRNSQLLLHSSSDCVL
jgi:hypothetical protein